MLTTRRTSKTRQASGSIAPIGTATMPTPDDDDVTHVIVILDASGSMTGSEADVIGGVNSYVNALRTNHGGRVGISYVRFNYTPELVWNDIALADVPEMTSDLYRVRGNTALLDAVGGTVSAVVDNGSDRYIVITHTDGEENASREWTAEKVKTLIERHEATGRWSFSYFGADVDAWSEARRYGYGRGATMAFAKDQMRDVYAAKATVSNVMRTKKMAGTKEFARAAAAVVQDPNISDDEIVAILTHTDPSTEHTADVDPHAVA